MITAVPLSPAQAKPYKLIIHLETLPPHGLISQYGVCAGEELSLEPYVESMEAKFAQWKSNVKRSNASEV